MSPPARAHELTGIEVVHLQDGIVGVAIAIQILSPLVGLLGAESQEVIAEHEVLRRLPDR